MYASLPSDDGGGKVCDCSPALSKVPRIRFGTRVVGTSGQALMSATPAGDEVTR
jgi:glutaminase